MKKLLIISAFLFLCGCQVPDYTMKGTPDIAAVHMLDDTNYDCELIAVHDSSLIVNIRPDTLKSGKLMVLSLSEISSISVNGYNDNSWYVEILVFQLVPAIVLGIAAGSTHANTSGVTAGALIPAFLNTIFYAATTRNVLFKGDELKKNPEIIMPYAYFPGGITDEKLESLMMTGF